MRQCRARMLAGTAVLAVLLAAGCGAPPAPPQAAELATPTPLSSDDYAALKASYLAANPDARVGRVVAVLPSIQRVAVGDIAVGDFQKGDILAIVDDKLNPLADGTVVDSDADYLYVNYVPVAVASRAPVEGDIVIRAERLDHSQAQVVPSAPK